MKAVITKTTDGKHIGEMVETDLFKLMLPTGELFKITGRLKTLDGHWRVWSPNYIIELHVKEE